MILPFPCVSTMKTPKTLRNLALPLGCTCLASGPLLAVPLHWDGNSTTGNADGGAGTWDIGTSNWDSAATAGLDSLWPALSTGDDDAVFGGSAGTVSIAPGGVVANDLLFNTASYIVSGGPLTLDGTTPTITNAVAATINSNLVGSVGLRKSGNGTLVLGGTNSGISGALVISGATSGNNGGIQVQSNAAFGGFTSVDIQANSFLNLSGVTIGSAVPISVAGGGGASAPQGAIKGLTGVNVVNSAVTLADSTVRFGNLGTSLTFNGTVTATAGSGRGMLIRTAAGQGVIFSNSGNYWEGSTTLGDGSVYFHAGALPTATNLVLAGSANTWLETSGTFNRAIGTAAGQVQFNATAGRINGMSARGGDLSVNFGGGTALTWGTTPNFNPGILGLAGANATGTLTLQNSINLGAATRTINVENGSADVDARITGNLTNGVLTKTGGGTLTLAGTNSFTSATLTFGTASTNLGAIRLESNSALGGVTAIAGNSGTGGAQARIELANNVNIAGIEYRAGGRQNATTTGAAIVNVSGDNTWGGTIRITNTGGSYGIRSDGGRLTIAGNLQNGIGSDRVWELTGAGNFLVSGNIVNGSTGGLSINKSGNGTLTVTGTGNTYSLGTTISAGTFLANNAAGSATGSGAVTVNGGTLGGTGALTGAVTVNSTGILAAGASIESLATGALTFNTGSTFLYELNTTGALGDLVDVNGNLDLNGTVTLSLLDLGAGAALANNSKFVMISYAGTWTPGDIFNGYADDSVFTLFGNEWLINYDDTSAGSLNGGAFANAVTLTVVPEPGAALLGGLGLLALLRRRR